jgi:ketosteroid isomerase-like protein
MDTAKHIEQVKKNFADFAAGNTETFFDSLHPDVVWEVPSPKNHPAFGVHNGKSAFRKVFEEILPLVEFEYLEVLDVLGAGDRTAAIYRERVRVLATGKTLEQEIVMGNRWKHGKIIEYREYIDSAALEEAFSPD